MAKNPIFPDKPEYKGDKPDTAKQAKKEQAKKPKK